MNINIVEGIVLRGIAFRFSNNNRLFNVYDRKTQFVLLKSRKKSFGIAILCMFSYGRIPAIVWLCRTQLFTSAIVLALRMSFVDRKLIPDNMSISCRNLETGDWFFPQ